MVGMKVVSRIDMTKEQVQSLFRSFNFMKSDVPIEKEALFINHPNGNLTRISLCGKKSTYGKDLYAVISYIKDIK